MINVSINMINIKAGLLLNLKTTNSSQSSRKITYLANEDISDRFLLREVGEYIFTEFHKQITHLFITKNWFKLDLIHFFHITD